MQEGSAVVFYTLIPAFMGGGCYLLWYWRRRKNMLAAFAAAHGFSLRPEQKEELREILERCFSPEGRGEVRNFSQMSGTVAGDAAWYFEAVELLDLNPHAQSSSSHCTRIVALFPISTNHYEYFLLDRSSQVQRLTKRPEAPAPGIVELVIRVVDSCRTTHPLSVTLRLGYGLIYFEPLVTGGETQEDVNCLYCIAESLREALAG